MPSAVDLTPREFRNALLDHGFAYLPPIDRYVDIRQPMPSRFLDPVRDANGEILRRETLAALRATRTAILEAQALIRQANDQRQARAVLA